MSILHHSVIPENNRATYGAYDVVDFRASFPTRMMNLNSLRLTGTVQVKNAAGNKITTEEVQLDSRVGAHSLISNIQSFVGGISIDNIMEYPRMVKMITTANTNTSDMFQAHNICELKAPNEKVAKDILRRETTPVALSTPLYRTMDFSIKPVIGLNQVYSQRKQLSYQKSGDVRVVITLNRDNAVMFGNSVVEGYSYTLTDLRLEFTSYPDDGDRDQEILFKRRQGLKQSFASTSAQLNFNFPMVANKIFGSFLFQADENIPLKNTLALQKVPNVSTMGFYWNNSTNEYISYEMRSDTEIIERFIDAVGETGRNSCSLMNIANNDGYGVGLNLGSFVDLMATKLSVVIESELSSTSPMLLTLFAEGISTI